MQAETVAAFSSSRGSHQETLSCGADQCCSHQIHGTAYRQVTCVGLRFSKQGNALTKLALLPCLSAKVVLQHVAEQFAAFRRSIIQWGGQTGELQSSAQLN